MEEGIWSIFLFKSIAGAYWASVDRCFSTLPASVLRKSQTKDDDCGNRHDPQHSSSSASISSVERFPKSSACSARNHPALRRPSSLSIARNSHSAFIFDEASNVARRHVHRKIKRSSIECPTTNRSRGVVRILSPGCPTHPFWVWQLRRREQPSEFSS